MRCKKVPTRFLYVLELTEEEQSAFCTLEKSLTENHMLSLGNIFSQIAKELTK